MGVKQSPDIAQQIMEEVLQDIAETDPYMDDLVVFQLFTHIIEEEEDEVTKNDQI
jgi:hypothetical protein